VIHIVLHFLVPAIVAFLFFRSTWKKTFLILVATMLVDLDHLLADPIYDPNRCSVGFHPLHSYVAIGVYTILLLFPKTRVVAIGLLIHMILDYVDCFM
jgi:hypothetical protein